MTPEQVSAMLKDIGGKVKGFSEIGRSASVYTRINMDFGVDYDQFAVFMNNDKEDKAEVILTSSIKPCAKPVYDLVATLVAGETPVTGCQIYGIAEGAAGAADNEYYQANATDEAKAIATQITEDVLAGTLEVTSAYGLSLDELNAIFAATTVNFVAVSA